nr:hypothetical protein GCM10020093_005000 [Planobispora longispora]
MTRCIPAPDRRAIQARPYTMCGQVPRLCATTVRPRSTALTMRAMWVACTIGVRRRGGSGARRGAHHARACRESITTVSPAVTGPVSSPRRPYNRSSRVLLPAPGRPVISTRDAAG